MEHGLLRLNAKPPYSLSRLFGASDSRQALRLTQFDNRIHFALNCGALSCPYALYQRAQCFCCVGSRATPVQ